MGRERRLESRTPAEAVCASDRCALAIDFQLLAALLELAFDGVGLSAETGLGPASFDASLEVAKIRRRQTGEEVRQRTRSRNRQTRVRRRARRVAASRVLPTALGRYRSLFLVHDASGTAMPKMHTLFHRTAHTSEVFYDDKNLAAVFKLTNEVERRLGSRCDMVAASQGQGDEHGCERATMHAQVRSKNRHRGRECKDRSLGHVRTCQGAFCRPGSNNLTCGRGGTRCRWRPARLWRVWARSAGRLVRNSCCL